MKVMVVGTIRGKDSIKTAIDIIVDTLQKSGHVVYHEHLTGHTQLDLNKMSKEENFSFHKKILEKIKNADIVVAEVSSQSLSVGYLIAYSVELGKPTIICYASGSPEPNLMPTLTRTGKILLAKYTDNLSIPELITEYVNFAKERVDVRFNFFISPEIGVYLDWVSLNKKVPRSVYLRNLIEKDMSSDPEYNAS